MTSKNRNPSGGGRKRKPDDLEKSIRFLAGSLGEALAVIQKNRIVFANDRLAEVIGVDRDRLDGLDIDSMGIQPEDTRMHLRNRSIREEGGKAPTASEVRIIRPDKRMVVFHNRTTLIQWAGAPATLHFLEDITARKSAEKQLREQKEVNSILADTVRRILASKISLDEIARTVLDSSMNLTGSRSGILVIRDGEEQKVLEHRCVDSCTDCVLPKLLSMMSSDESLMMMRRPGRITGSFYLNHPVSVHGRCSGTDTIRNVLRVPFGTGGSLSGDVVLADAADLFGPRELESMEKIAEVLNLALVRFQAVEEIRVAKDRAEQAAEARSQFLANVGHEIRSPLNGVLMMASLLQETDLSTGQRDLLDVVVFSARTIDRLIRDLTDLTQIRTGRITITSEEFVLTELVRHIVESNRSDAKRKGLTVDYRVDPSAARITGDRDRIGQIVSNLIINAIKFTDHGGVDLTAAVDGRELRIDVVDTGIGIEPEYQQAVFGLFQQGSGRRRSEGTGIGLAVVKELSEVMGGHVELTSRPGAGSRFTVFLPLRSPDAVPVPSPVNGVAAAGTSPVRVLVVEDEGVTRLYMRTLLEREGWTVDEAADGVEAVDQVGRHRYRLILMDINMPRMDGLEATRLIRERYPELPVIAVTAHAYEDDHQAILEAGMNDIILKPIDENTLKSRIRPYVRTP